MATNQSPGMSSRGFTHNRVMVPGQNFDHLSSHMSPNSSTLFEPILGVMPQSAASGHQTYANNGSFRPQIFADPIISSPTVAHLAKSANVGMPTEANVQSISCPDSMQQKLLAGVGNAFPANEQPVAEQLHADQAHMPHANLSHPPMLRIPETHPIATAAVNTDLHTAPFGTMSNLPYHQLTYQGPNNNNIQGHFTAPSQLVAPGGYVAANPSSHPMYNNSMATNTPAFVSDSSTPRSSYTPGYHSLDATFDDSKILLLQEMIRVLASRYEGSAKKQRQPHLTSDKKSSSSIACLYTLEYPLWLDPECRKKFSTINDAIDHLLKHHYSPKECCSECKAHLAPGMSLLQKNPNCLNCKLMLTKQQRSEINQLLNMKKKKMQKQKTSKQRLQAQRRALVQKKGSLPTENEILESLHGIIFPGEKCDNFYILKPVRLLMHHLLSFLAENCDEDTFLALKLIYDRADDHVKAQCGDLVSTVRKVCCMWLLDEMHRYGTPEVKKFTEQLQLRSSQPAVTEQGSSDFSHPNPHQLPGHGFQRPPPIPLTSASTPNGSFWHLPPVHHTGHGSQQRGTYPVSNIPSSRSSIVLQGQRAMVDSSHSEQASSFTTMSAYSKN